VPRVCHSNF